MNHRSAYRSRHLKKPLLAALFALLAFSGTARAWWNGEWTAREKITLDAAAAGLTGSVGTAPVLIRLHDGDFQFGGAKDDGSDLRIVAADDKTLVPFHIEKYDGLLNEAFLWVKTPDLKPGEKPSFWLYYGNGGSKAVRADDPKGTYDSDTVLVYHFAERGTPPFDSTGAGNNAQNPGTPVEGSQIGGGLRLTGNNSVTIPASPSLAWKEGAAWTWSAWVKPAALQPNAVIFSRGDAANAVTIGVDNGIPFVDIVSAGGTKRSPAGAPIVAGVWRHLAVVAGGPSISLYLDGELYATLDAVLPALDASSQIGGATLNSAPGFIGELDELEISRVARAPAFIKFAAASQGGENAAKMLVFGQEEQPSNWLSWLNGGYFGVIIKSLTRDGWVIICLLAVMAAISWFVMVNKISYLNSISEGNALFLKEWTHIANDLTLLDEADPNKRKGDGGKFDWESQKALRDASIYRIYRIGVDAIRHRLALRPDEPKSLSTRAIAAIRARLDGGLVRETQRLNNRIVLLTICISGGPFLGLLGTVIGVMITFAAVAAAGDVNVNAIAPGIAAALLATVAGLAVAIPSLFGYNYILSRVKQTTADMHVFIDEFVTSMAEYYRGGPAE